MSYPFRELPLSLAHGPGSSIAHTLTKAAAVVASGRNVVIGGEPGTGKEGLARLIHAAASPAAPFVVFACQERGEQEAAAELFGVPGEGEGALGAAHGGTLLLDEVGCLPASLQGRLVRTLESQVRVEGARLAATTTEDLLARIEGGRFRRDLYDALSTKLRLDPLRERRDDILVVVDQAWRSLGEHRVIASGARELMRDFSWPGNVRQIVDFLSRLATSSSGSVISVRDVERELFTMATGLSCWGPPDAPAAITETSADELPAIAARRVMVEAGLAFVTEEHIDLGPALHNIEDRLIDWALTRADGCKATAAQFLGMQRTTLVEKLRRRQTEPA
jgi:sigma-54 specific flagellar transcriptional regulator A